MGVTKTLKFFWVFLTSSDVEKTRQAEIEAFGGGLTPKAEGRQPTRETEAAK